jgi:hypothetical protein
MLVLLLPPIVVSPVESVGYEPPAGEPGVVCGESLLKQLLLPLPGCKNPWKLPPEPKPLLSPATIITPVPVAIEGVQDMACSPLSCTTCPLTTKPTPPGTAPQNVTLLYQMNSDRI